MCLLVAASLLALMQLPDPTQAQPFTWAARQWRVMRTVKAAEDTQLTASTQQTAPDRTDDGTVYMTDNVGAISVRFRGTDAADETLAWTLWAWKHADDAARYVAHGTATLGLTETGNSNEFYADTIVITQQEWFKTAAVSNGAHQSVIADAGIACFTVDSCEYPYWKVVIRDIAGGGAEAATAGADITSFQ
jgi:hypothetical protein